MGYKGLGPQREFFSNFTKAKRDYRLRGLFLSLGFLSKVLGKQWADFQKNARFINEILVKKMILLQLT